MRERVAWVGVEARVTLHPEPFGVEGGGGWAQDWLRDGA
jgi:hypothetical protein